MSETLTIKTEFLEPLFTAWEEPLTHRVRADRGVGIHVRAGRRVPALQRFEEFSQLVKAFAPALRDLIDGEKYARDFPLFVGQGLLDEKAPAVQTNKPGVSFA